MGHILFGAPGVARFHLHQVLARTLAARGHRVYVLTTEPAELEFYCSQGMAARLWRPGRPRRGHVPLAEFVDQDRRLGQRRGGVGHFARLLGSASRGFETDPPDLVVLHQGRTGLHRMLHFLGREFGSQVLHTGDGLLPGTMQWDGEGIDGDAAACRRSPRAAAPGPVRRALLDAALAGWLARSAAPPLSRARVVPPERTTRLALALHALLRGQGRAVRSALVGWRDALPPPGQIRPAVPVPPVPFVAVLLQDPRDPRVRLDAPPDSDSVVLALRTGAAVRAIDPDTAVVAVLPDTGLPHALGQRLSGAGLRLAPPANAPELLATASAAVTINHPLGLGALLADTPVLHTGRTPYGVRGVATRTSLDQLDEHLAAALDAPRMPRREAFLSHYLAVDQVWCAPDAPDHNGLNGLISGIEACLQAGPMSTGLRYRAGPVWPLAAAGS